MDWYKLGERLQRELRGEVKIKEPLKNHTTWRVGGPADLLVIPQRTEDVEVCQQFAQEFRFPFTVIGNGSNLLVSDAGVRGLVVKMARGIKAWELTENILRVEAGALLPPLIWKLAKAGWGGLEFTAGIPATVGGATVMNAGANGECFGERVQEVVLLQPGKGRVVRPAGEFSFGYRTSNLRGQGFILSVTLELEGISPAVAWERIRTNWARRRQQQPLGFPSAGSVFVNPPGYAAGWLLEQVGAKGLQCGGARVSEKHANFILNTGGAKARDIQALIRELWERVAQRFGIWLELEIEILGEEQATKNVFLRN